MTESKRGEVSVCADEPCPDCPWRTANRGRKSQGKVEGHGYGYFTQANRNRLWSGVRRGEPMTCHPTDPEHPGVAPDAKTKECAGALVLQQRELMVLEAMIDQAKAEGGNVDMKDIWRRYRKERPGGVTREGMTVLAWNATYGAIPFLGGREMGKPNLMAEVEVGSGKLAWPVPELGLGVSSDS